MRGLWAGSLVIALGLRVAAAYSADPGMSAPARSPTPFGDVLPADAVSHVPLATLGLPVPAATLERPVPMNSVNDSPAVQPPVTDSRVVAASYDLAALDVPQPIVRAQAPDPLIPGPQAPPPPPIGTIPVTPNERYNCGVVTDPPPASSHPFLDKCGTWIGGAGAGFTTLAGKFPFQSDHGFDFLASPVSNPLLFEDPRALTELRPIFMYQQAPLSNYVYHGGDIEYLGLQARLAVTQRLSFVMTELGLIWMEPHDAVPGFSDAVGFAELRLGPKYTFYRNDSSNTIVAGGLNFDIPVGDQKVFQNTGSLSLEPYISAGQNFFKTSYGSINVLDTLGYSVATDNQRTDFLFNSFHIDYDVANIHKIYPLLELNYFYDTSSGKATSVGFEGRDLFNFGSTGVSGQSTLSIATGVRYKFNECIQTGFAAEFPLTGQKQLLDYRLTFDLIFRF
jgi:hypothetical protein